MKLYRKRPVVIEAVQWDSEDGVYDILDWIEENGGSAYADLDVSGGTGPKGEDWGSFTIETLEGDMEVSPFDYVIRGVMGEFYACKPDVFAASYEGVV